jgi:hypothetical protein
MVPSKFYFQAAYVCPFVHFSYNPATSVTDRFSPKSASLTTFEEDENSLHQICVVGEQYMLKETDSGKAYYNIVCLSAILLRPISLTLMFICCSYISTGRCQWPCSLRRV